MAFDTDNGAIIEIMYYSGEDTYYARFTGSYYYYAGELEGYLVSRGNNEYVVVNEYTGEIEARIVQTSREVIEVTEYGTHGGMHFPGFDGTYTLYDDYSNAG